VTINDDGPAPTTPDEGALVCPTPCDDDCEAFCHESHNVGYKRTHWPEDCPGHPLRAALAAAEAERDAYKAAVSDETGEGIRLWMLDCAALTEKHRNRADAAEAERDRFAAAIAAIAVLIDPATEKATYSSGSIRLFGEADIRRALSVEATGTESGGGHE
jgi:hypothetical protein